MTPFTTMSAERNMFHGDRSRGSREGAMLPLAGTLG
jgi:hypothetical protein